MDSRKAKEILAAVDRGSEVATPTNEAVDSALKNIVIISKIGRYLDFVQLKGCRLVNKVWNDEILIAMRKRDVVFRVDPPVCTDVYSYLPSLRRWKEDFGSKVKFMKKLKIGNIKLNLLPSTAVQLENTCRMMTNFGDGLQYLAINMKIWNGNDGVMLSKILQKHPLGSLQEVELDLDIKMDGKMIKFPILETVTSLKIRNMNITRSGCEFMGRILSNRATVSPFPNLKSLELHGGIWRDEFAIKFLQQLITFPRFGLENLVIDYLPFGQPVSNALREALERHAPTLKSLRLCLSDFEREEDENFDIVFPHFPKLKKLELNIMCYNDAYYMQTPTITWRFPRGQVVYKDDFPLLEDFKLGLGLCGRMAWGIFLAINALKAFAPLETHQKKCHTMKRFHFHFEINGKDLSYEIWLRELWESFEDIFPNAVLTPARVFHER